MSSAIALDPGTQTCPLCGNAISSQEFARIQARIAEQERKRLTDEQARMRHELQVQKQNMIAQRDTREAAIRKEAAAQAEARVKSEAEKRVASVVAERDQGLAKLNELEMAAKKHKAEIEQVRVALEKDRDERMLKLQAQHTRENGQLQQKISALTRQLERKTADDLGEGAEVDVYQALRDAFPHDAISRIKRGQPGADICQEVLYKGQPCGTILVDSKNRQAWQHGYVTKLREDQMAAKADHAVLATTVFPSEKKELYIDEDTKVIVINRARVVEMVGVLRREMIRMQGLKLSASERNQKRDLLYRYITSEDYRRHQAETGRIASALLDLDVEEKHAHDRVWEKRGKMMTRLRNVVRETDAEVGAILEGRPPATGGTA
jgi:hypothetical protein